MYGLKDEPENVERHLIEYIEVVKKGRNDWEEEYTARDLLAVHLKDEKRFDEARKSIKKARSCAKKNAEGEKLVEYVAKVEEFLEDLDSDESTYKSTVHLAQQFKLLEGRYSRKKLTDWL